MSNETMWFITGRYGLYYGGWRTRAQAIEDHCEALGRTWQECRRNGDRAIKCEIIVPEEPAHD